MTHAEFVAAYQAGKLTVHIDGKAAAQFVSRRMMLPLMILPFFGLAVGLALVGQLVWGAVVFLLAFGFRFFVRSSARGFILARALEDPVFYQQAVDARILTLQFELVR